MEEDSLGMLPMRYSAFGIGGRRTRSENTTCKDYTFRSQAEMGTICGHHFASTKLPTALICLPVTLYVRRFRDFNFVQFHFPLSCHNSQVFQAFYSSATCDSCQLLNDYKNQVKRFKNRKYKVLHL